MVTTKAVEAAVTAINEYVDTVLADYEQQKAAGTLPEIQAGEPEHEILIRELAATRDFLTGGTPDQITTRLGTVFALVSEVVAVPGSEVLLMMLMAFIAESRSAQGEARTFADAAPLAQTPTINGV